MIRVRLNELADFLTWERTSFISYLEESEYLQGK